LSFMKPTGNGLLTTTQDEIDRVLAGARKALKRAPKPTDGGK